MTVDEVKALLEQAATDVGLLQSFLPPGQCRAFSNLFASLNAQVISNVIPGATAGGVQQIVDSLRDAFVTLARLEESGRLDRVAALLRSLEDRRILMWIAGKVMGTEAPELVLTAKPLLEDAIKDAVLAERQRCANIAWKLQSYVFGGGTVIGNAIEDLNPEAYKNYLPEKYR